MKILFIVLAFVAGGLATFGAIKVFEPAPIPVETKIDTVRISQKIDFDSLRLAWLDATVDSLTLEQVKELAKKDKKLNDLMATNKLLSSLNGSLYAKRYTFDTTLRDYKITIFDESDSLNIVPYQISTLVKARSRFIGEPVNTFQSFEFSLDPVYFKSNKQMVVTERTVTVPAEEYSFWAFPFIGFNNRFSGGGFWGYGKLGVGVKFENEFPPTYLLGLQWH